MRVWDLKTGRCLKKSTSVLSTINRLLFLNVDFIFVVEAHNPFVQCVTWGPTPVTEGSEESDRIVNVVATGGTDKVRQKSLFSSEATSVLIVYSSW